MILLVFGLVAILDRGLFCPPRGNFGQPTKRPTSRCGHGVVNLRSCGASQTFRHQWASAHVDAQRFILVHRRWVKWRCPQGFVDWGGFTLLIWDLGFSVTFNLSARVKRLVVPRVTKLNSLGCMQKTKVSNPSETTNFVSYLFAD